jgi:hypothetical protein
MRNVVFLCLKEDIDGLYFKLSGLQLQGLLVIIVEE